MPDSQILLTVLPGGRQVPVLPGHTLLQAALREGLALPASCRNGSCRTCISRLVQGQVHHRIDWPSLLADEIAEGWILPCVAEPAPGCRALALQPGDGRGTAV
ncbi:2Fe-2S iron-sulfur cluster-binding protein [Aquabacterium sp. OR-4]|uniref:2Fe-2S iron-sulfur cluster-binding protein n=1 Tax=Aquabacterium sp. OR-4 TaxID=2978127 RepID=UPI0021B1D10D|nr:2Fe-2S iron-sulfur cluster-binding protein [Aquabacterium sp. OR-4]MDT7836612.1 2Fe-2S iron-sulfur cluster-binding protein [Aquabacterium sp. OR-4]